MWPRAYTVNPQVYIRTGACRAGREGLLGSRQGVVQTHRVLIRQGTEWSARAGRPPTTGRCRAGRPARRTSRGTAATAPDELLVDGASKRVQDDAVGTRSPPGPGRASPPRETSRGRPRGCEKSMAKKNSGAATWRNSIAKADRRARGPGRSRRRSARAARRPTRTPARRGCAGRSPRVPAGRTDPDRN